MTEQTISGDTARRAPSRSRAASRSAFDEAVFLGFLAALAVTPLLSTADSLLATGVNAVLFGVLAALYEIGLLIRRRRHPVAPLRLAPAIVLLVLLVGFIVAQILPMTPPEWHHPLWDMVAQALGRDVPGRISLTPEEGVRALVRLATAACAFWLALQLCRSQSRAGRLLWALVTIGVGYALAGISVLVLRPSWLKALGLTPGEGGIVSTFPDPDSYAVYAGLGLVLALGLLIDTYRWAKASRQAPLRYRLSALIEATVKTGFVQVLMCLVLAAGLLATLSRSGFLAAVLGCAILVALTLATLGRGQKLLAAMVALGAFGGAALLLWQFLLSDQVVGEGGVGIRLAVAERALDAARDVPWTGFGYGSFQRVFPMYRDGAMLTELSWDKARSTAVELVFELGYAGAALFALLMLALLGRIGWNVTHRSVVPMLGLVALAASAQMLLVAVAGSSLQVQAVAISYWAVLGAGLAQSWSGRVDTAA